MIPLNPQLLRLSPSGSSFNWKRGRRQPEPRGRPGYLRIDTVHSPEQEGEKGAYSINVVDEVTQWQAVGCVQRINENHLIPLLEGLLEQFPFIVRGFHSRQWQRIRQPSNR